MDFARRFADAKQIVEEHCTVRDEAFILDNNKIAAECVRLHADIATDLCPRLDLNERPNKAPIADRTALG